LTHHYRSFWRNLLRCLADGELCCDIVYHYLGLVACILVAFFYSSQEDCQLTPQTDGPSFHTAP
jgi:hypothetical protein